ncbi:MAG: hypothetical protein JWP75_894 [Frondihabitans sp.]|nr:hypothetical protein [Frondihabitans sp.]
MRPLSPMALYACFLLRTRSWFVNVAPNEDSKLSTINHGWRRSPVRDLCSEVMEVSSRVAPRSDNSGLVEGPSADGLGTMFIENVEQIRHVDDVFRRLRTSVVPGVGLEDNGGFDSGDQNRCRDLAPILQRHLCVNAERCTKRDSEPRRRVESPSTSNLVCEPSDEVGDQQVDDRGGLRVPEDVSVTTFGLVSRRNKFSVCMVPSSASSRVIPPSASLVRRSMNPGLGNAAAMRPTICPPMTRASGCPARISARS